MTAPVETRAADIEAAARAALVAAWPRARDVTRRARPTPDGKLPAFAVTVEPEASEVAGMKAGASIAEGTLRVEVWVVYRDEDREALAEIGEDVRRAILPDAALGGLLIVLEPAAAVVETSAEASRFARVEVEFSVSWLERRAGALAGIAARFGLA